jgi:hypothetical protein
MSSTHPPLIKSIVTGKRTVVPLLIVLIVIIYYLWPSLAHPSSKTPGLFPITLLGAKNIAAIIENRSLSNLVPLILHFSTVLGPEWPIVIFTGANNPTLLNTSIPFQRVLNEGRVQIRHLPPNTQFENHAAVSDLLTTPWFWEQLAPAGHVLLFQADSILCANSDTSVDDFLEYDFVGAPINVPAEGNDGHGEGFNGGLSLRNRTMILDIVKKNSWKTEKEEGKISMEGCVTKRPCLKFEDQWFYHKMKEVGARFASKEVAATFAVETVWYDRPLGYHQVERWNAGRMAQVAEWCPEYQMATTDLIVKHGKDAAPS